MIKDPAESSFDEIARPIEIALFVKFDSSLFLKKIGGRKKRTVVTAISWPYKSLL